MKHISYLIAVYFSLSSYDALASGKIKAAVLKDENFHERYIEALGGRNALEIDVFTPSSHGSHLEIVEMIILQQALHIGGLEESVIFEPHEIANLGEIASIVDGSILMYGRSMWMQTSADYQGSLYISEPVIEYGHFEAGLYFNTQASNLEQTSYAELEELKVVSNPRWNADWRALRNSPMSVQNFIGPWENMLAMVDAKIVDVMLINFSVSRDLDLIFGGKRYRPIKGLKVVLPDSRHFVVSKKHPKGKVVFQALEKGLRIMREQGKIRRLYQQAGVFNHLVQDWEVVNKNMLSWP